MAARFAERRSAPGRVARPPWEQLRADGVPLIGYTWFPFTALVDWAIRESTTPIDDWIVQMGMVDLHRVPGGGALERHPTANLDDFDTAGAPRDAATASQCDRWVVLPGRFGHLISPLRRRQRWLRPSDSRSIVGVSQPTGSWSPGPHAERRASVRRHTSQRNPDQVPGLHLALALDVDRSPTLAHELVVQQLVRRPGHLDFAGRPVALDPACRVHGVAPRGRTGSASGSITPVRTGPELMPMRSSSPKNPACAEVASSSRTSRARRAALPV